MSIAVEQMTLVELLRFWHGEYHTPPDLLLNAATELERLQPFEEQTRHLERRIRELTEQLNCMKIDAAKELNLQLIVKKFTKDWNIGCSETIYQSDRVIENSYEFIEKLCDVVGYHEEE